MKIKIWDRQTPVNGVKADAIIKAHGIKNGSVGIIEDETGKALVLQYDDANPKNDEEMRAELEETLADMEAANGGNTGKINETDTKINETGEIKTGEADTKINEIKTGEADTKINEIKTGEIEYDLSGVGENLTSNLYGKTTPTQIYTPNSAKKPSGGVKTTAENK